MEKKEISKFQIDTSKKWADGQKYFSLFEKHIPSDLDETKNILIYDISNLDAIIKIIQKNPKAKYWIYGNHEVNECLRALGFDFTEVVEDPNSKTYNIP